MESFAALYTRLDSSTKTNRKLAALVEFFQAAAPADAAWALFFLKGERIPRGIPAKKLHAWAAELASVPRWLFDESYDIVGDIAETIALLLPEGRGESHRSLANWVQETLLPLKSLPESQQQFVLKEAWRDLGATGRFVWNKLLTGGFRVGVSEQLVVRAIAEVAGLTPSVVSFRLMGKWQPSAEFYEQLIAPEFESEDISRPYPFCLAPPLEAGPDSLGPVSEWQAEWKWDGIRAQLVRRNGQTFLWSRGEELITDRFPDVTAAVPATPSSSISQATRHDGFVLDGEIIAMHSGTVLPFAQLQRRIGRKSVGKKLLSEVPAAFLAFDLLELDGTDFRSQPLEIRRRELERLLSQIDHSALQPSPVVVAESWEELAIVRQSSRERHVEGLMLKRKSSAYGVGRHRGDWWKWKIAPLTVDAVLIYAQRGHGRRASLYTDYTFAVWNGNELVPFAKAYSGLTDAEIKQVDQFVRANTREKFGPVRSVTPELVFELAFENIQLSSRHKSGIAVRFPRIVRWRTDKSAAQADTLESVKQLLSQLRFDSLND